MDGSTAIAMRLLFDRAGGTVRREVRAGTCVYQMGDAADAVHLVERGLLAVERSTADGDTRRLGFVRAGECVGEMAVLAQQPRSATVFALRDSRLASLPADLFLEALESQPRLAIGLAQLVARRARTTFAESAVPRVVLIEGITAGVDPVALASAVVEEAGAIGVRALFAGVDSGSVADQASTCPVEQAIDDAEPDYDLILLACGAQEPAWLDRARRHADRILLLAAAEEDPPPRPDIATTGPAPAQRLADLVLAGNFRGGGAQWRAVTETHRVHRLGSARDGVARLVRMLTGRSVGLVLSGGGARAFAHVGAIRALRGAGVPIDLVGGTSMGAIIAAGVADGWDDYELDGRIRDAFVNSNPLDDIAFPIVALTRGREVERRLESHFGARDIADLALPFFCVSADLTSGTHHCHDTGPLAEALRASISLPGVLPPVIRDGHVLVDGGVLRNLPTDLMRARHQGTVIGSDVTRAAGLFPVDLAPPPSWLRWFASGAWRKGPPIVSLLMRSATVPAGPEIVAARNAADLYVMPDTNMVEIRDWRAYPNAVEAGYRAMNEALEQLDQPVTDLRHQKERGM